MKTISCLAVLALLVSNLFSFALMGWDKRCARRGNWRVPEKRLFLATGCFGALGMYVYRHKTKHWYFRIFFPLMLVAQIAILVLIAGLL